MVSAKARHIRKMVIGATLLVALRGPAADVAMVDRLGIGGGWTFRVHELKKPRRRLPVVRADVVESIRLRCDRRNHTEELGRAPLNLAEQIAVRAELQDRAGARLA